MLVDFSRVEDLFRVEKTDATQHVTNDLCLVYNTNEAYDKDDDEDECDDFFLDYCAPDDDALLTRITRGDDHTAERYGRAIDSGVLRRDGGLLRRGLGGCGNFGTFFSISLFSLFFSVFSKK